MRSKKESSRREFLVVDLTSQSTRIVCPLYICISAFRQELSKLCVEESPCLSRMKPVTMCEAIEIA